MLLTQDNKKLAKNETATWGLSLMPAKLNSFGINLCTFSTKECRKPCIVFSGGARFEKTQLARLAKTDFYLSDKAAFIKQLWAELNYISLSNDKALVRLNVFSDIDWYNEFLKFNYDLTTLGNITFYGYTKNPSIVETALKLKNFEIVFSFSGYNWKLCEYYLINKICNVAVVFKTTKIKPLPTVWQGFEVLNGDESDERLSETEGTGKVIGLKYKNPIAKGSTGYQPSKFVIEL